MYEYLSPGTARRTFTDANLTAINTNADRFMKVGPNGGAGPGAVALQPLASLCADSEPVCRTCFAGLCRGAGRLGGTDAAGRRGSRRSGGRLGPRRGGPHCHGTCAEHVGQWRAGPDGLAGRRRVVTGQHRWLSRGSGRGVIQGSCRHDLDADGLEEIFDRQSLTWAGNLETIRGDTKREGERHPVGLEPDLRNRFFPCTSGPPIDSKRAVPKSSFHASLL